MLQNKALLIALGVSAVVHLSAVSIFSIGVWFPVEKRVYHRFDIVEEGTGRARLTGEARAIDLAELDTMLSPDGEIVIPSLRDRIADTIQIQAPTIDFGGLERRREGQLGIRAAEEFELSRRAPRLGPVGLVGERIGDLTSNLREMTSFWQDDEPDNADEEDTGPIQLEDPAPGFEAYIVWLTGGQVGEENRTTLLPLTIPALRDVDPADWPAPVSLVIKVDPSGRVIEALSPPAQQSTIMQKVGLQVLNTRFRSLPDGDTAIHTGSIIISAKDEGAL